MANRVLLTTTNILSRLPSSPVCQRLSLVPGQYNQHSRTLNSNPLAALPSQDCLRSSHVSSTLSSHPMLSYPQSSKPQTSSPRPLFGLFNSMSSSNLINVSNTPISEQYRFYQAALRPRLICPGCYFVWRHGRKHVECSDHPRHKQMKKVARRKMWKEDYTKGDWNKALDFHKVTYRQAQRNTDKMVLSHPWLAAKLGKEI